MTTEKLKQKLLDDGIESVAGIITELERENAKLRRYVDFVERHADPDTVRAARMEAEQITTQDIAETMPPKS